MRRNKGYYIDNVVYGNPHGRGVKNKIQMQIESMSNFADISLLYLEDKPVSTIGKILKRLPFFSTRRNYKEVFRIIDTPDFLYIRRVNLDLKFVKFLWKLKKTYPFCKMLLEIPTYPYKGEMLANNWSFPLYAKDCIYRQFLRFSIDKIVLFDNHKRLFGIDCIYTMNGIDVKKYSIVNSKPHKDNLLNIIYAGELGPQHGLERIIEGLKRYYERKEKSKETVVLHCAGSGTLEEYYKSLVEKYRLSDYIIFHGYIDEDKLNGLYDKSDLALAPLGMYKIGIHVGSFLKTREYLAKGLPIIAGCSIDVFEKYTCDYVYNVDNNSSIVDIEQIVQYYMNLLRKYQDRKNLANQIRIYAEKHIDYNVILKPIREYIEGN